MKLETLNKASVSPSVRTVPFKRLWGWPRLSFFWYDADFLDFFIFFFSGFVSFFIYLILFYFIFFFFVEKSVSYQKRDVRIPIEGWA